MRRQLALLVAATTTLVLVAFGIPMGYLLQREAAQRAVSAATLEAQSLASIVAVEPDAIDDALAGRANGPVVTVFMPDGRILGTATPRSPSVQLAGRGRAFTAQAGDGVEVLLPVQGLPGGTAVIRSYVPPAQLYDGVGRTFLILAGLALAMVAFALLLADGLSRRLVGSVTALAAMADRLSGGDLAARVTPAGPPETRLVGAQLNRLAGRVGELLAIQREETADLAHRLRTPVAAVRLDADSLHDPEERTRLVAGVEELARMVDEVIRTARRPVREGAAASADLAAVVRDRVRWFTPLADDTERRIDTDIPDAPIPVRAAADDLEAMVDALLGNAFAHTPDGTPLLVTVAPLPAGGARLVVADGGPGLDPNPERLLVRGTSGVGSTGLGLDIARRTAQATGGDIHLGTSGLGGAHVEVTLGPP